MTLFDDQFAARVREAFDAYDEPVDEAALARMRAALGHGPARAPDRSAVARRQTVRRRGLLVALAAVLAASGVWWTGQRDGTRPVAVETAAVPETAPEGGAEDASQSATPDGAATEGPDAPALLAEGETPARVPSAAPARRAAPPAGRSTAVPAPARLASRPPPPALAVGRPAPDARLPDVSLGSGALPAGAGAPARPGPDLNEALLPLASAPRAEARSPVDLDDLVAVAAAPRRVTVPAGASRSGAGVVVATTSAFSDGARAEGVGTAAGVTQEWALGRGLRVSGGALAAYNRFSVEPPGPTAVEALAFLDDDPTRPVDVTERTSFTTVALDVPLDLAVDLAETRAGRVGLAVGVTSSVYLAQSFDDVGETFRGERIGGAVGPAVAVSSEPFEARETRGPLSRIDLARQANVALSYTLDRGPAPVSVQAFARLPLGGLTARDLPLTVLGVRLRYRLP